MNTEPPEHDLSLETEPPDAGANPSARGSPEKLRPSSSHRGAWLNPRVLGSAWASFIRQPLIVHDLLAGPPTTEQDRIKVQLIRAKHDRYISLCR